MEACVVIYHISCSLGAVFVPRDIPLDNLLLASGKVLCTIFVPVCVPVDNTLSSLRALGALRVEPN